VLRWILAACAVLVFATPLRAVAGCGDGALESGEECDDGNTVGGDGCSASCLLPWAVVVAGQSNAEGRSTIYQDLPTGRVTSPDPGNGLVSRMFRARYTFDTGVGFPVWTRANSWPCSDLDCTSKPGGTCQGRTAATHVALDPICTCHCGTNDTDANEERASAWPTFAQRIMVDVGRETELVYVARGSTSLVQEDGDPPADPLWDSNVSCAGRTWSNANAWIDERGDMYCLLLRAVAQSGVASRLKAVLWYQGEDDARWATITGTQTGAQYQSALETLADALWTQLGVPMIVAPVSLRNFPGDSGNSALPGDTTYQVHDATLAAVAMHLHIYRGPSTDDLEHEDFIHVRDVVTLGERWASALRFMLAGLEFDGVSTGPLPTQCNDGIDNDGDGLSDAADPGCADAGDLDERSPALACDDGVDGDGDGRADFDPATFADAPAFVAGSGDPGCHDPASPTESPACQNGVNDDGALGTDFDGGASVLGAGGGDPNGRDPQCADKPWRNRELPNSCGLGAELALVLAALARLAKRR
jgi:cysteine-rich repeat protein